MSRAVLVTGASRGIGRAVAQAFAERGDQVAVHYGSSPDGAEQTMAGMAGGGHLSLQADLSDPEQVRGAVDEAARRLGRLDVLVNNAGVSSSPIRPPRPPTSSGKGPGITRWA